MPSVETTELREQLVCLVLAQRYMRTLREADHPHPSEDLIVRAIGRYRRAVVFVVEEEIHTQHSYGNKDIDPATVNRAIRIAQAHSELLNDR